MQSGKFWMVAIGAAVVLLTASTASAWGPPGPNETTIEVKKDCGASPAANCSTSLSTVSGWIATSGSPSASKRFVVNVGAGTWNENWTCAHAGYVTVRGAGRENTLIVGDASSNPTIKITNCVDIEFRDMTIQSESKAVSWSKAGNSTWTDVDIVALGTDTGLGQGSWAWFDDYCYDSEQQTELPVHYFYSSNLTAHNQGPGSVLGVHDSAFYGACSDVWFYGGELSYFSSTANVSGDAAVHTAANSKFRAYGSLVRATVSGTGTVLKGSLVAVEASDLNITSGVSFMDEPGVFHMHGGIINVTVGDDTTISGSPDATAVWGKASGSMIHTLDTAYVMNTPDTVPSYRSYTNPGAMVMVPLLWQAGAKPPMASTEANRLILEDGKDMWVETDCGDDGDCSGGGAEAHLMVYNSAVCTDTADPWFDTVTARCRNDIEDSVEDRLADLQARMATLESATLDTRITTLESANLDTRVTTLETHH